MIGLFVTVMVMLVVFHLITTANFAILEKRMRELNDNMRTFNNNLGAWDKLNAEAILRSAAAMDLIAKQLQELNTPRYPFKTGVQ